VEGDSTWEKEFVIQAVASDGFGGSGIERMTLFYRFNEDPDKLNETDWIQYENTLVTAPYEWDFSAEDGDGHYEFYVELTDAAGNAEESEVLNVDVNVFPSIPVVAIAVLGAVLIALSAVIIIRWGRKRAK